ncbi:MAG: AMP-binding protein [Planctomycetes bacterium]|nr:AMP-binding protein [Planctomycetota bacterium]
MTAADRDPFRSLNHEFHATTTRHAGRVAFERTDSNHEHPVTYGALRARVDAFAAGLAALGLRPQDRVALVADNRLDWFVADRGILLAGGIDVPQPAGIGDRALELVLRHSGSRMAVVEGPANRDRIQAWAAAGRLPRLVGLVRLGESEAPSDGPLPESGFEEVAESGRVRLAAAPDEVADRAAWARPGTPATIVYTSGTTGTPKGVVLTHGNILHNIRVIPAVLDLGAGDRYLSILPAWHMFERTLEYILLHCGATLIYTSRRRFKQDLVEARPTVTAVVPRLLEMVHGEIQRRVAAAGRGRRALARSAFAVAVARARAQQHWRGVSEETVGGGARRRRLAGLAVWLGLAAPHALLDRLVCARLRQALCPTLRMAVSGGGALPRHIDEFLNAIGFPVLVGYGLTETAPVVSARTPEANPFGTIGKPLPETEVEIRGAAGVPVAPGAVGVIHIRGPQVMRGYFRRRALTRRVRAPDGWLDSGDLGVRRPDGEIRITGRAKDTIVLRSGENVEPQPLEASILRSPYIEQVVLVGQDRKELGALIVPAAEAIAALARREKLPGDDLESWLGHDRVARRLLAEVRSRTARAAGFATHEAVRRIHVLTAPFSVEDGTLTPTLKLRRDVVLERYAEAIAAMYEPR